MEEKTSKAYHHDMYAWKSKSKIEEMAVYLAVYASLEVALIYAAWGGARSRDLRCDGRENCVSTGALVGGATVG
jgi:hypothetical protein